MKILPLLCISLFLAPFYCRGEIEKIAIPSQRGLDLYWWPKVGAPYGFFHDEAASRLTSVKMFVPKGFTFSNAETVIYAKASFKSRMPKVKSLKALIEQDLAEFKGRDPNLIVNPGPSIKDGDNKQLDVFSFVPSAQGNWETVAYSEEGEFYLLFTISSRSKDGHEACLPLFKAMIEGYRRIQ
jgi:hypothetical protein